MTASGALYFHAPCFDGVVSAVFAMEILGWVEPELRPTGYELRATWLQRPLESRSAVVDFLFHPEASFWADHHPTTFLGRPAPRLEQGHPNSTWIFDPNAGSCAGLLFARFPQLERHRHLARWADKIDAARYENVEEAIFGASPALVISKGLAIGDGHANAIELVRRLSRRPLDSVAADRDILDRFERSQRQVEVATSEFAAHARMESGDIVVADIESENVNSRYAPYYKFPRARYSVVLFRTSTGAKITAMRNPWNEFEGVSLGNIFSRYGGGGHQRVASLLLSREQAMDAKRLLSKIVDEIRTADGASRLNA